VRSPPRRPYTSPPVLPGTGRSRSAASDVELEHRPGRGGSVVGEAVTGVGEAGLSMVCLSPPPPALYEAAERTASSSPEAAGVPLVQVLTAAEVAGGKRPKERTA